MKSFDILQGFSTTCKPDGIRAIYQYVTFSKDALINGFDLSVTATADQLESQVNFLIFTFKLHIQIYYCFTFLILCPVFPIP